MLFVSVSFKNSESMAYAFLSETFMHRALAVVGGVADLQCNSCKKNCVHKEQDH